MRKQHFNTAFFRFLEELAAIALAVAFGGKGA